MALRLTALRSRLAIAVLLALLAAGLWSGIFYKVGRTAHFVPGPLMVSTRSALAICVDSKVPGVDNNRSGSPYRAYWSA